jgi:hypothetical protein
MSLNGIDANESQKILSDENSFKYYKTNKHVKLNLFYDRIEFSNLKNTNVTIQMRDIAGCSLCKSLKPPDKVYLTIFAYLKENSKSGKM